jgi:uncharacterized protein Usg
MTEIERQLNGYRLTTAEIIYRMPDHLDLLQTYVWQALDLAPKFLELNKFLSFWEREIEGPLYAVKVANTELLKPARTRHGGIRWRCTKAVFPGIGSCQRTIRRLGRAGDTQTDPESPNHDGHCKTRCPVEGD